MAAVHPVKTSRVVRLILCLMQKQLTLSDQRTKLRRYLPLLTALSTAFKIREGYLRHALLGAWHVDKYVHEQDYMLSVWLRGFETPSTSKVVMYYANDNNSALIYGNNPAFRESFRE